MIKVNQEICIGCDACAKMCPLIFELDEEGRSRVVAQTDHDCAKQAVDACPVQAISLD